MRVSAFVMGAALALSGGAVSANTLVFSENFDGSPPAAFSGAGGIESSQGYDAYADFGGNFWRNDSQAESILSLNGLGSHEGLRLEFSLAIIDSWDGGSLVYGPDPFVVKSGGTTIFEQLFPGTSEGVTLVIDAAPLGFNSGFIDRGYRVSLDFEHTGGSAMLSFAAPNSQGLLDESWAIDNVAVYTLGEKGGPGPAPIPLPATALSLIAGMGALGAAGALRRRRR